jgi:hypothetical protein
LLTHVPGVTAATIGNYMFNQIVDVQRHNGNWTNKALYSQITKAFTGQNPHAQAATTTSFQLHPASELGDLYISYWLKFQPGMTKNMIGLQRDPQTPGVYPDGGTWRSFFAFKTGTPASPPLGDPLNNGDYRVETMIQTGCPDGFIDEVCPRPLGELPAPYWVCIGDNLAGGGYPNTTNRWSVTNHTVPVPDDGQWVKVEVFWHRSGGPDGRFWMAINGAQICNHDGANLGEAGLPINRIVVSTLYTGGRYPIYQWVDDIQIWEGGFPTATDDPPYAPH